ncbi:bacillithiol system redox-active protein YtxJ [Gracilimonas sp.]|uniref:bacillithiol system redox-active protein YtxJ n=1 Tax=Gracilimonas sp. TaxID=1974203 RepID=UPI0032EC1A6A
MSIFSLIGNLFGSEDQQKPGFKWNELNSEEELSGILQTSNRKTQVIYKHSSRCATCYFAQKNVESISTEKQNQADYYIVDVIGQRPLSMHIADELGIRHESPQLFVIKEGKVTWHGSHNQIIADTVSELV